jgi:hypothetical protein
MYTSSYIKSLYVEYEEWDTAPGSMVLHTDQAIEKICK